VSKFLRAKIGARYWEDSLLNGVSDEDKKMPFIVDEEWIIDIDLSSGRVIGWPIGSTANIHYKSVDQNSFYLLDKNKNITHKYEKKGVPDVMCPIENGGGDYVILDIDKNGFILDFDATKTNAIPWEAVKDEI